MAAGAESGMLVCVPLKSGTDMEATQIGVVVVDLKEREAALRRYL